MRNRTVAKQEDFLDELIAERTEKNPAFPAMVDAAARRRELLRALAAQREGMERSQTAVAAAMATSQSTVARLETVASDARMSTVDRYAASLGMVVQYHLLPAKGAGKSPTVVVH